MPSNGSLLTSAPFIRLLIPLCLGVCIPVYCSTNQMVHALVWFLFIFMILLIYRGISFYWQHLWGILVFAAILIFGVIRSKQELMVFLPLQEGQYFVVLDDFPSEKEKTYQIVAQLVNSGQKMLIYLPKSAEVRSARPGDVLSFVGTPALIQNDGNPYEFDYKSYLNDRKIGYRIFLKEGRFCFLNDAHRQTIYHLALILRAKLIDCLDRSGIGSDNVHLIASISFGARDEVDKEVIQSFTNTGVIHVLAVSGMNVGLIFIILNVFFRFLKSRKAGNVLYTLIILSGIWSYTLITGMSASILRAAMMFSFVVLGNLLNRNSNIYNSLAVSAFLLIALNPHIIRDVGFQLSYVAVLSIVVIQPAIYKQLYFKNWLLRQTWMLISVTIAAQVGTFPFTLHYFHQFPVYFLLANLVVIPLVTLILYLSFAVVFLSVISGFIASLVAVLLDWSMRIVLLTVTLVQKLPHSVIKGLYPNYLQLFLFFLIGFLMYEFFRKRRGAILHVVVSLIVVLVLTDCYASYCQLARAEIIFFNIPGTRAIALTRGRETVVLYDKCEKASSKLGYYMSPYFGERGIDKVEMFQLSDSLKISYRDMAVEGDFVFFRGVRLYMEPLPDRARIKIYSSLQADVVWMNNLKEKGSRSVYYSESGAILCSPEDMHQTEKRKKSGQQRFGMNRAIQLEVHPDRGPTKSNFTCHYF